MNKQALNYKTALYAAILMNIIFFVVLLILGVNDVKQYSDDISKLITDAGLIALSTLVLIFSIRFWGDYKRMKLITIVAIVIMIIIQLFTIVVLPESKDMNVDTSMRKLWWVLSIISYSGPILVFQINLDRERWEKGRLKLIAIWVFEMAALCYCFYGTQ